MQRLVEPSAHARVALKSRVAGVDSDASPASACASSPPSTVAALQRSALSLTASMCPSATAPGGPCPHDLEPRRRRHRRATPPPTHHPTGAATPPRRKRKRGRGCAIAAALFVALSRGSDPRRYLSSASSAGLPAEKVRTPEVQQRVFLGDEEGG
jgi:hypothetical protein